MQVGLECDHASNVVKWNNLNSPTKSRTFGYDELKPLQTASALGLWGDLYFTYNELGSRLTGTLGGDAVSLFHPDHLGSALYITNESGAITWEGDYFPFGAEFSSNGTPDRYRFTQHELDPNTALLYAKARCNRARVRSRS